ncbi:MAG: glycosyltransferase family 2 protein [Firmicutes bacterium]|nr:glycosyltransferase family 2 protein [Bacillota bacterium]
MNTEKSKNITISDTDVSVITCTNKPHTLDSIINNFNRQSYEKKELIIVLNSNKLNLYSWRQNVQQYNNVNIYQLDEKVTLGECLNFAINKSKYGIIAKFDDDDYYGPRYLSQAIYFLKNTIADVVGKSTSYVYFSRSKTLAIRNSGRENRYVPRVEGPTLVMKRKIFDKVRFSEKNLGEDVQFCKDCCKNKIRIYSTDKSNFVYIRNGNYSKHTWGINDNYYLKLCNQIGQVNDYRIYANS